MRCFQNIAKLIREKRLAHTKAYSQAELSHLLGYKNGQFISNVERSLCSIPLKMLRRVSEILDIPSEELKLAVLKDQELTLNRYLYGHVKGKNVEKRKVSPAIKRKEGAFEEEELLGDHREIFGSAADAF